MKEIVLYTRNGCHLCSRAEEILDQVNLETGIHFSVKKMDIDQDPKLVEKYDLYIPVIEMDGEIIQYGKIVKGVVKHALCHKIR